MTGAAPWRLTLVVTLTVRAAEADAFHDFEHAAARAMRRYGGSIERAITMPEDPATGTFTEVHIVTFPDEQAFAAYRADEEMMAMTEVRERSIVATQVMIGRETMKYEL